MKISPDSLLFALNYICRFGDTNIFPVPFEFEYIEPSDLSWISKNDSHMWQPSEPFQALVAKKTKGFRSAALLHPIDSIFYTAVVVQGGKTMEANRIPVSEEIVFSNRFKLDTSSYNYIDTDYNWSKFLERSIELANEYEFVLKADIADFFPRIYLHDIERTVLDASDSDYERTAANFFKKLNTFETVGVLPTGTRASLFLSEIVLNDLDHIMISDGFIFCRFADDFRIFADSKEACFGKLYELAKILKDRYHLSLQDAKTKILSSEDYIHECKEGDAGRVEGAMKELFEINKEFLAKQFLGEEYFPIVYEELDEETKAKIDTLHLDELLEAEMAKEEMNVKIVKRILNLSFKVKSLKILDVIISELEQMFPVLDIAIQYLIKVIDKLTDAEKLRVKDILVSLLLDAPYTSVVPFYRIWLLEGLLAYSSSIQDTDRDKIIRLYDSTDDFTKRQIILLLGRLDCKYWFRRKKAFYSGLNDWQKSAFIKGFSECSFSKDERSAFLRTIKGATPIKDQYLLKLLA